MACVCTRSDFLHLPSMNEIRLHDYSLVGKDTASSIEGGLAEATWYASRVPKQKMRKLLSAATARPSGIRRSGSRSSSAPASAVSCSGARGGR